jgi:hypothetical protein
MQSALSGSKIPTWAPASPRSSPQTAVAFLAKSPYVALSPSPITAIFSQWLSFCSKFLSICATPHISQSLAMPARGIAIFLELRHGCKRAPKAGMFPVMAYSTAGAAK